MPMGDFRDLFHVRNAAVRIAQRFDKYRFGIVFHRPFERFGRVFAKIRLYTELRERMRKQVIGAAVHVGGADQTIARAQNVLHRVSDRRRAARERKRGLAPFQRRDPPFERVVGGIGQPPVNVAALFERKAASALSQSLNTKDVLA